MCRHAQLCGQMSKSVFSAKASRQPPAALQRLKSSILDEMADWNSLVELEITGSEYSGQSMGPRLCHGTKWPWQTFMLLLYSQSVILLADEYVMNLLQIKLTV